MTDYQREISKEVSYVEVENKLKALPAVNPAKWIPVSERLPEIKRDVLVSLKNGRFFVAALFAEPFPDAAGQCYRWIGEEEISFRFCDVEAWMPLPEPYQAESNLDGNPVDIDKAVEHYEGTLETLKGIDLEDKA